MLNLLWSYTNMACSKSWPVKSIDYNLLLQLLEIFKETVK